MEKQRIHKRSRWYFGGISSTLAMCATHPFDVLKVQLQAQQNQKQGFLTMAKEALRHGGLRSIYAGLDANIVRHMSSTMFRLGFYDAYKNYYFGGKRLGPLDNVIAAGVSGIFGGVIGNPTEVIKVRMQNDMKLPTEMKRNYKNVFDGLGKIIKHEGFTSLFKGVSMTCTKSALGTFGQAAGYEEVKYHILKCETFNDDVRTHILSAFGAGVIMLAIVVPFDVIKTRLMNGSGNRYSGIISCVKEVASNGPLGFYKGLIPSFIRIMPHNILLFIIKENLTKHFGI